MRRTTVLILALCGVMMTSACNVAERSSSRVEADVRERCVRVLKTGLSSDEFWPSMHAAEALTQAGFDDVVLKALGGRLDAETDDQRRCGLAREMARARDRRHVGVMLSILANKQSNGRVHAAESLYKVHGIGDGKALRAALDEGDPALELMAAAALVRGGDEAQLARVRRHLAGSDARARRIAAWILGRLGDRSDWPALQRLAGTETDPLSNCFVINALAQLGAPGALEQVERNLQHEDTKVRAYSAQTVGDCRAAHLIKPLVRLLDDPNLDTRIRAAQSILLIAASP